MAKGKKKNKGAKNSFYKSIKPFISDNRVLFSIIGAAGAGIALASVFGTEKGKQIVDRVAGVVNDLTHRSPVASKNTSIAKQPA
ncbi:MAG: hypothetical protein V4714_04765 [Bacteroidota bacterium]